MATKATLKKRGFDNPDEIASGMCNMWAQENGVEREFAEETNTEPVRRSFALSVADNDDMAFTSEEGIDSVSFPVIAITSGPHEYEVDGEEHKVYIEGSQLKDNLTKFTELPIYVDHQRTAEDLIGMAANPELIEMDNGKTAVKMLATVSNKYGRGQEVMNKVKEGDMTHVSIDWFSNDIDVMGDTYATKIRPTEVSFIDNEKMDPIESFKEADAKRTEEEAATRKASAVEAIISKEVLFGTLEEDKKDGRVEELSAWDEPRLTGFSEALAAMPEPTNDTERTFGKGKSSDDGEEPETKREFGMKKDSNGEIRLNAKYYRGE